ncbi:MAG: sigma 54-dependent Fis family transcriptional regulator, partial [Archangium sp.]|nr:sigma 54-dependent Fis family transcriptional regulator [Archangium sp.]
MDTAAQTQTITVALKALPVRSVAVTVLDGPDKNKVARSSSDRLTIGTAEDNDLVLTDPTVSGYHLELRCLRGEIIATDHGSTNGTSEGVVRLARAIVPPGATLKLGQSKIRVDEGEAREVELLDGDALGSLRGKSQAMRRLMALVAKAAATEAPVLITGESGTGKELIAGAVHDASARASGPLVVVDCGTLSANLIASELFGHEKGAFTGADAMHEGAFERAAGGTLFLDEIGELPLTLQPTLLGVLERKKFRRVGGKVDLTSNVRVVVATNRDLRAEVNAGRFRLDLFHRLAVVKLEVPPLRDRLEDVPLLVDHFLSQLGGAPKQIPLELMQRLRTWSWPGNVRELRNFVEATLSTGEPPELVAADTPGAGGTRLEIGRFEAMPYKDARAALLEEFEKHY